jgi:hypothetical protein
MPAVSLRTIIVIRAGNRTVAGVEMNHSSTGERMTDLLADLLFGVVVARVGGEMLGFTPPDDIVLICAMVVTISAPSDCSGRTYSARQVARRSPF